jgi:hypothetical protein
MAEPAYKTHEDAQDPAVQLRIHGLVTSGGKEVTLSQLMKACKSDAENGRDPFAQGTVEVGLLLEEDKYVRLKEYAKSLPVEYAKTRRRT